MTRQFFCPACITLGDRMGWFPYRQLRLPDGTLVRWCCHMGGPDQIRQLLAEETAFLVWLASFQTAPDGFWSTQNCGRDNA
jgi:hypothetical protein